MRNFAIHFQYPWLLLLLIPAFALTLTLYLLLNKKFRRTRNRIVSIVLHSVVMVLCVLVLAGTTFTYDVSNLENEILLLVDVSDTAEQSASQRDWFVNTVISESGYDGYKVGIVTFGFDQRYAVPLTYNTDSIYPAYQRAEKPDTSATDIAAALRFISQEELFSHPETGKIVLITDGKETDEKAASAIGAIARKGITVDTVYISSDYDDNVQVVGVEYPDYHINQNENFDLTVSLQCKAASPATTVSVYDNGVLAEGMTQTADLGEGDQKLVFPAVFATQGLHELRVTVTCEDDRMESNNAFSSYYYLEVFGNVLILEHKEGESEAIKAMLETDSVYAGNVQVLTLTDFESLPKTVEQLRQYDQIILNNVANGDMKDLPIPTGIASEEGKDWFVKNLYSYVYDYGGGLFTVGGRDGTGDAATAHAYNRNDLYNTLYQELLPVQAIDYTPPVAVMLIIDISGSMGDGKEGSPLYYAKQGAVSCLSALTERDYVGVMTLDTVYGTILPITSRTEETRIREAILNIGTGEATVFSSAIKTAGERLRQQTNVDKRHIVIVSDGMPGDDTNDYLTVADDLHRVSGITISVVGVGMTVGDSNYTAMKQLTDLTGGQMHTASGHELIDEMRNDLNAPAIKEFNYENFNPVVADALSPVFNGVEYGVEGENRRQMTVTLGGFFGVKKRESAEVLLMGDYDVPIYAQWKYGKGMVGSFLCDLDGSEESWSTEFMADANGQRFLFNVIANLMPTERIRPGEITLELKEENYINSLSVYTDLADGQKVTGRLVETTEDGEREYDLSKEGETGSVYVTSPLGPQNRYSRCSFVVKKSGVYKLIVEKFDADGTLRSTVEIYKAFSYSEEYDCFFGENGEQTPEDMLASLAVRGNGEAVSEDDPWGVFHDFVTSVHRSYDPRLVFIIIAMVLFLGDVAVRKFKFKWLHEIVRERRAKKAGKR